MASYEDICKQLFNCLVYQFHFNDHSSTDLQKISSFLQFDSSFINEKDEGGITLLNRVLNDNCPIDIIRILLDYGADVNSRYEEGHNVTILMVALYCKRDAAVIRLLIERGADIEAQDDDGATALCHALGNNASMDVLKLLLEGGCHPNACREHASALECLSVDPTQGGLKEGVLDLLIEAGADVLRFGSDGESPVCFALTAGAGLGDIQRLLRLGASLDACQKHASVWLCATNFKTEAEEQRRYHREIWGMPLKADVFELLRTASPPVDSVNEEGYNPLQLALYCCNYQMQAIYLLMEAPGCDFSVKDEQNRNLLHLAVENVRCKKSAVKVLIERGVELNELNSHGLIPLSVAIDKCTFDIAELLLKSGSPVNVVDVKLGVGKSPLDIAIMGEKGLDIIKLLLLYGARIDIWSHPNIKVTRTSTSDPERLLTIALEHYFYNECQEKLEILKLLLKHYFLEKPGFEMDHWISRSWFLHITLVEELTSFANECVWEIQVMKSSNIDIKCTLLDFVKRRSFPTQIATGIRPSLSNKQFNRLLSIMVDNDLPQYFELISNKIGRSTMETKLKLYAITNSNEKIYLDYHSVCVLSRFLSTADLLRLILAYVPENYVDRLNNVSGDKKRGKRSPEHSLKNFQKHQKLE